MKLPETIQKKLQEVAIRYKEAVDTYEKQLIRDYKLYEKGLVEGFLGDTPYTSWKIENGELVLDNQ